MQRTLVTRVLIVGFLLHAAVVCQGQTQFGGNSGTKQSSPDQRKIRQSSGEAVIRVPKPSRRRTTPSKPKVLGKATLPQSPRVGPSRGELSNQHRFGEPFFMPRSSPRATIPYRGQRGYLVRPRQAPSTSPTQVQLNGPAHRAPPPAPTDVRRNSPPPSDYQADFRKATAESDYEGAFGSDPGPSDETLSEEEIREMFHGLDDSTEPDEEDPPAPSVPQKKEIPLFPDEEPSGTPAYTAEPTTPSDTTRSGTGSIVKSAKSNSSATKQPSGGGKRPSGATAQKPTQDTPLGKINIDALTRHGTGDKSTPPPVTQWPDKYSTNPSDGSLDINPATRWPDKFAKPRISSDRQRSRTMQRQVTNRYLTEPTDTRLPGPRANPVLDGQLVPQDIHDLVSEQRSNGHPMYDSTYEGARPKSNGPAGGARKLLADELQEKAIDDSIKLIVGSDAAKIVGRAFTVKQLYDAIQSDDSGLNSENDVAREEIKAASQHRDNVQRWIESSENSLEREIAPESMGRQLQAADLKVAEAKQYAVEVNIRDSIHELDKEATEFAARKYNRPNTTEAASATDAAASQQRIESVRKHVEHLRRLKDDHDAAKAEVERLRRSLQSAEE